MAPRWAWGRIAATGTTTSTTCSCSSRSALPSCASVTATTACTRPTSTRSGRPWRTTGEGGTIMNASMRSKLAVVLALATVLAGCEGPCSKLKSINAPGLGTSGIDLSTYVAVGTSLTSGYESGGLVDRHQVHSFPSLFARQIGKTVQVDGHGTFTQPTVDFDGIPALLEIKSYSPLIISSAGRTIGAPTNFSQNLAYHNLGVPGAILFDLVDSSFYHAPPNPVRADFTFMNLIQR